MGGSNRKKRTKRYRKQQAPCGRRTSLDAGAGIEIADSSNQEETVDDVDFVHEFYWLRMLIMLVI